MRDVRFFSAFVGMLVGVMLFVFGLIGLLATQSGIPLWWGPAGAIMVVLGGNRLMRD